MDEIILQNKDGVPVVSSREVAEHFNKQHGSVLKTIYGETRNKKHINGLCDEILASGNPLTKYFIESTYENRGKNYKECFMTRDGFSLVVMGFTGKEALEWKLKYIEAFNKMEEKLKEGNYLSEEEKLKLQLFSKDPAEVAYAHNRLVELETAPLRNQLEEQKPLVYFANKVSDSSNLIDMGKMAKLLKDEHIDIGRNRLFEWLRKKEILMKNNMPYQRYIDSRYFQVKESTYETPYGTKTQQTTLVTGKGQIYITERLRKEWNKTN